MARRDGDRAQRVEDVGAQPQMRVPLAGAAASARPPSARSRPSRSPRAARSRPKPRTPYASQHASSTWHAERERVLERLGGPVQVAPADPDLGRERLRDRRGTRSSARPAPVARPASSVVLGPVELAPEQMRPPEERASTTPAASPGRPTPPGGSSPRTRAAAWSCAPDVGERQAPDDAWILASSVRVVVGELLRRAEPRPRPEVVARGAARRSRARGAPRRRSARMPGRLRGGDAAVERGRALLVLAPSPRATSAEPSASERGGLELGVAGLARRRRPPRSVSTPAATAPALDRRLPGLQRAPAAAARPPPVAGGAARRPARAACASSGPGSTPSSRRNRSIEAVSWRSTATSSPVPANARISRTCASSSSGSAATSRVASSTAVRALPDASARSAPSRSTASLSACRRRRSPSSQAVKPGLASISMPSRSSRPRPGELDGLDRRTRHQHVDVERRALRQAELHDVAAADRVGTAEEPPELRQVPAQRARGVLGVGEQEVDQLLPARRAGRTGPGRRAAPTPSGPAAAG